jgi:hypothetical protein
MKTEITFASSTPLTIPKDAQEIAFQQRSHGGYLLQYKQTERAESAGVILITEQERTIETRIFSTTKAERKLAGSPLAITK